MVGMSGARRDLVKGTPPIRPIRHVGHLAWPVVIGDFGSAWLKFGVRARPRDERRRAGGVARRRAPARPESAGSVRERSPLNEMLSIVIPAYNEEDNVRPLYDSVMAAVAALGREFEVIVVDDGSRDATFERLAALAADDPRLKVIKLRRNYGQTPALAAGIDHARGEILVTMDADLQNDPDDIGRLVWALEEGEGHDLVVGWRRDRKDAWLRTRLSQVANRLIARITGVQVRDNGCTLKAFRAELIKSIPLYSEMHRFLPALMSIRGCRLLELPVNHRPRQHGSSKYGFSRIYKVFFDLMAIKALLVFARRPLLCFFGTTAAAIMLTGVSGGAALYYAVVDQAGPAVIFMALAVLLGSLAIFLALGGTIVSIAYAHFLDPGSDADPAAEGGIA